MRESIFEFREKAPRLQSISIKVRPENDPRPPKQEKNYLHLSTIRPSAVRKGKATNLNAPACIVEFVKIQ